LLNKKISARSDGVWLPFLLVPALRKSQIVCANPKSTTLFQFQTETAILQEWFKSCSINQLVGFENNEEDGTCYSFNFILSNGTRSTQRDEEGPTDYKFMIPADALNKIRSVNIHYSNVILSFSFFDKDGALLWEIGYTDSDDE
jgi:hypothetical protein